MPSSCDTSSDRLIWLAFIRRLAIVLHATIIVNNREVNMGSVMKNTQSERAIRSDSISYHLLFSWFCGERSNILVEQKYDSNSLRNSLDRLMILAYNDDVRIFHGKKYWPSNKKLPAVSSEKNYSLGHYLLFKDEYEPNSLLSTSE